MDELLPVVAFDAIQCFMLVLGAFVLVRVGARGRRRGGCRKNGHEVYRLGRWQAPLPSRSSFPRLAHHDHSNPFHSHS